MSQSPRVCFAVLWLLYACVWDSFAMSQQRCEMNVTSGELDCSYKGVKRSVVLMNDNHTDIVTSINFSGNEITEIEQLYRYPNVVSLNLGANSISQVGNDTFVNVTKLENLDLSANHITTIHPFLFSENKRLRKLYLRGNIVRFSKNTPLLCSASVQVLDLSHCGIESITKENLMCLPAVVDINLQHNSFTSLAPEAFSFTPSLTSLALRDNPFSCHCDLVALAAWLRRSKSTDLSTANPECSLPFSKQRSTLEEAKSSIPLRCDDDDVYTSTSTPSPPPRLRNDSVPEVDYIVISYEMDFRVPESIEEEESIPRKARIVSSDLYLVQTIVPVVLLVLVVATWLLIHRLFWSVKRVNDDSSVSSYDSVKGLLPMLKEEHTYVQVK